MKTTTTLSLAIALGALAITGTSCNKNKWPHCPKANGKMKTETRSVDKFTSIELEGSGDVYLYQVGSEVDETIEIEASGNILDEIKTKVKNGKLTIGADCIRGNSNITYTIKVADLSGLTISGSGTMTTMNEFTTTNMDLEINGSGDMNLDLQSANINSEISGSGNMDLDGTCTDLDIEINGSGDIRAFDMPADNCFIDISGSGNCQVYTDGSLIVRISGSGDVVYDGNPAEFSTDASGSGTVSKR